MRARQSTASDGLNWGAQQHHHHQPAAVLHNSQPMHYAPPGIAAGARGATFPAAATSQSSPSAPSVMHLLPNPLAPPLSSSSSFSTPLLVSPSTVAQLQQASALIALACAMPTPQHVLITHDIPSLQPAQLLCIVPRGIPAAEFVLDENTDREDLSAFLLHADTNHGVVEAGRHIRVGAAASSSVVGGGGVAMTSLAPITTTAASASSTATVTSATVGSITVSHHGSGAAGGRAGVHRRLASAASEPSGDDGDGLVAGGTASQQLINSVPKVVLLHNVTLANVSVVDALMDLLTYGLLTVNHTTRKTPLLRVVALASSRDFALVPAHLRCAFLLSTYLSTSVVQSFASFDAHGGSSVFPRARLFELCQRNQATDTPCDVAAQFGQRFEDDEDSFAVSCHFPSRMPFHSAQSQLRTTVVLSPSVESYCVHLLGVVRGSLSPFGGQQAVGIVSRVDAILDAVRVMALLCHPSASLGADELLRPRRVIAGATEVQCLLPCCVSHWLRFDMREFLPALGAYGVTALEQRRIYVAALSPSTNRASTSRQQPYQAPVSFASGSGGQNGTTTIAATDTPVDVLPVSVVASEWLGVDDVTAPQVHMQSVSAIGVPLTLAAQWDAVAAVTDAHGAAAFAQSEAAKSAALVAAGRRDAASDRSMESSRMDVAGAPAFAPGRRGSGGSASSGLQQHQLSHYPRTANNANASAALSMQNTIRLPHLLDADRSFLGEGSGFHGGSTEGAAGSVVPHFLMPYEWCRHIVASTLRDRSQPPPG